MAVSKRYPTHAPGAAIVYALDLSNLLPPGMGVTTPGVTIQTNTVPPGLATGITASAGGFKGRQVWITISGGIAGTDYIITWNVNDTTGNTWMISLLLLCAQTS